MSTALELEVMPSVPAAPDLSGLPSLSFETMKVTVTDQTSAQLAKKYRDEADDYIKSVDAAFEVPAKAANLLHKFFTGWRGRATAKADEVKRHNDQQILTFKKSEEAARLALERELQRKADAAAKSKRDAEIADAMLFGGDVAAVEAAPLLVPQVTLGVSRVPGISTAKKPWSYEVVDLKALLKAVLDGTVDAEAIQVNHTFMTAQARYYMGELSTRYPGVNGVQEERIKR